MYYMIWRGDQLNKQMCKLPIYWRPDLNILYKMNGISAANVFDSVASLIRQLLDLSVCINQRSLSGMGVTNDQNVPPEVVSWGSQILSLGPLLGTWAHSLFWVMWPLISYLIGCGLPYSQFIISIILIFCRFVWVQMGCVLCLVCWCLCLCWSICGVYCCVCACVCVLCACMWLCVCVDDLECSCLFWYWMYICNSVCIPVCFFVL